MSKSDSYENDLLLLIFNATTFNLIAENDTTSPTANLTVALHTADPTDSGTQASSEIAYTGYARQNVARASGAGGWTVAADTVTPTDAITFPEMTGGAGGSVTYFSIGTGTADEMLYHGAVNPTIVVVNGVIPELTVATNVVEG